MAVLFSESKTKQNLMRAFAGEGQARNRYTFAAEQARKEGKPAVADIFLYTADQERAHAGRYYELLKDRKVKNYVKGMTFDAEIWQRSCKAPSTDTHSQRSVADTVNIRFSQHENKL